MLSRWSPVSWRCRCPAAEGPCSEALPSKSPPGRQRPRPAKGSLITATPGSSFSPVYATGTVERVGGKNQKNCVQRKALRNRIPTGWGKKEKERRSADGPDPEKDRTECRLRNPPPLTIATSHAHTPTAAEPRKRRGGDLGSHTSPQSSWSE